MTMTFDKVPALKYLGLPEDYSPAPDSDPIAFLNLHLSQLPPNILQLFSDITTHKQRTSLVSIRNRRLRYVNTCPPELRFVKILATVDSRKIPMETKEIVLTKLSVLYEASSSYEFG